MATVEEKRKLRFQFLNSVYEKTEGDKLQSVNMFELGKELGWDESTTDLTVQYLVGEGLIKHFTMGGNIIITHNGVVEIENALAHPQESTNYFPPVVNIMSGDFRGAILNIDSTLTNLTQNIGSISNVDESIKNELAQLVEELKNALSKVPSDKTNDVEAVAWAAESLIKETISGKANPTKIEITKDGLKKAASNIASVVPTVLLVAERIIAIIDRIK